MSKHYIVVDAGFVVDGFSDAFRVPIPTDILIATDAGRQFVFQGNTNQRLKDDQGYAIWKQDGGDYVPATQEEQPQWEQNQKNLSVEASRHVIAYTDVTMTHDGFERMTASEQSAVTSYRDDHFNNIFAGGHSGYSDEPEPDPDLASAFEKFRL